MGLFTGEYEHKLDAKNRVFVPRRLLDQIDDPQERKQFQLVHTDERCLTLFTDSGFRNWIRTLQHGQRTLAERRRFNRRAGAKAQPVPLDAQGRITIPQEYREELGLGDEVLVVGALDWIEIWDPQVWRDQELPEADAEFRESTRSLPADRTFHPE